MENVENLLLSMNLYMWTDLGIVAMVGRLGLDGYLLLYKGSVDDAVPV